MKIWQLILEARRRRVFRGAGLYVVGSWVLLQIADVVVVPLSLPTWSLTALLYMMFLCFPVAVFLSWRYQINERGISLTTPAKGTVDEKILELGVKDYVIFIAVLTVVLLGAYGLFGGDQPVVDTDSDQVVVNKVQDTSSIARAIMPNSVAVLPFTDMSTAQDQEYFAHGLADTILHLLTRVRGLNVAARTSSFLFQGKDTTIVDIGSALGVQHVLEGSVQKAGNRLKVIAQLIETEQGSHVWSGSFEGQVEDIFDIQDEIALAVVAAMRATLSSDLENKLGERYRPKIMAYDQLVLGLFAANKLTVSDLKQAAEHFNNAIKLDPQYALPNVYLAMTLGQLEVYALGYQDTFSGIPTSITRSQQEPLIKTALKLDPLNAEAYALLGAIEIDKANAEDDFQRAIELNPNSAIAHLWYSKHLSVRRGDYEKALEHLEKTLELDPLSNAVMFEQAKLLWALGQAERAVANLLDYVKRSPDYPPYYKLMVRWQSQLGDFSLAARWVTALRKLDPDSPSHWGEWGGECWVLHRLADYAAAQKCDAEFIAAYPQSVAAKRVAAQLKDSDSGDFLPGTAGMSVVLDLYKQLVTDEPGNDYRANQYAFLLEQAGKPLEVLTVLEASQPRLFSSAPIITGETTWPASMTISAFQDLGQTDKAEALLAVYSTAISKIRLIQGPGFTNGIEDVEAAAMGGDSELALQLLRRAIDKGWRFVWDALPYMKTLRSIQKEPKFMQMSAELEADIALQRARYYATKGEPLF